MIKFLDLQKQYLSIKSDIDEAIQNVLNESAFIGGSYVATFEKSFSDYQQASYCIGVGNGTDALEIAIESLELPQGSEIIVPANSFIASAEAVTRTGHKIVFCDVNSDDYSIDIEDIKKKITNNTKAIMAVHLYGHPCDMDELISLARRENLRVIEDCAQAHGAKYKGHRVGAIGDIGAFSFYPGKNLGAYGDGGAIVTDNEELALRCRMIANHGRTEKYNHKFEGRNSRLDGIQAAILSVKLKHLDIWTEHRIEVANVYRDSLKDVGQLTLPVTKEWAKHVFHLFVVRTENRDLLKEKLAELGVQTGVHYPIALPKLDAFRYLEQEMKIDFATNSDRNLLSLPMGDQIELADAKEVSRAIVECMSG